MNLNSLIIKNFTRNLKNYALYIFALVFSVALFFSLLTLTFDEKAGEEISQSTAMNALFSVGSIVIVIIIIFFVMFANLIFIKRRHRELALYQLIGMNKSKVFRILLVENFIIYFGSLVLGIILGLFISRLLLMILMKIIGVDLMVEMSFSMVAALTTAGVFVFIFVCLLIQNRIFLGRHQLIDLLKLNKVSESSQRPIGVPTALFGILGIIMVALGYFLSSQMFDWAMKIPTLLPILMLGILFLTIVGTYFLFKCGVALILNFFRKRKSGHVNVKDVLSTTSIMFKMRSNAFLLTIITVITAISITAMSLSYINFYSTEKMLESTEPYDYTVETSEDIDFYEDMLNDEGYSISRYEKEFLLFNVQMDNQMETNLASQDIDGIQYPIVSDADFEGYDVSENEVYATGTMAILDFFTDLEAGTPMTFTTNEGFEKTVQVSKVYSEAVLPTRLTFGMPTLVVDDKVYKELKENEVVSEIDAERPTNLAAFNIVDGDNEEVLEMMDKKENPAFSSQQMSYNEMIQTSGILMFVLGYLGFAFLLTSGCILYFKQIDECESEKGSYQVLRKLGFTNNEILRGLVNKMVISFGIPLIIGLLHSIFAVRSGWFIFGVEMWRPTLIVMLIYTILYSIFALMSLLYYKKTVSKSL